MKISELREKTDLELDRMLAEFRNKVRDLRFRVTARQLSDVRDIRETRKAIAQILTLKRSRRKT
ncbi:MAG: Ribosomal protein [Candidatus Parcubacteria bacterium]|jgi:ribosomal protein L29